MFSLFISGIVLGMAAAVLASLPMNDWFRRFCYTILALIFVLAIMATFGLRPVVEIHMKLPAAEGGR